MFLLFFDQLWKPLRAKVKAVEKKIRSSAVKSVNSHEMQRKKTQLWNESEYASMTET